MSQPNLISPSPTSPDHRSEPRLRASDEAGTLTVLVAGATSTAGRVEAAYVERPSAMVHEADIGDVAAVARTEAGHDGRSYAITGPEVITVVVKVRILSEAIGRPIALVELTPEQFEADLVAAGMDVDTIAFMHEVYGNTPEIGRTVSDVVPQVTGHPARTFAQWAATHADEFRRA